MPRSRRRGRSGPTRSSVFAAASEAFSRRNINCSIAESVERFRPVVDAARTKGIKVRAAVSVALGCPYQGEVTADEVEHVVTLMKEIGVDHCGIADTIGVGTPKKVQAAMERALRHFPIEEVSGHFHDTYAQGVGNVYAALEVGVSTFDASIAGLGGCPYAKGATGNVATEDVLFMLQGLGIDTGVSLDGLVDAAAFISGVLGRKPVSRSANARSPSVPRTCHLSAARISASRTDRRVGSDDAPERRLAMRGRLSSLLDERALDHVAAGVADAGGDREAGLVEHGAHVLQHRRPAADHRPVLVSVDLRKADVAAQLAVGDQVRQTPLVAERLARHGRVVHELVAHLLAEVVVARQLMGDQVGVGELVDLAHTVHQDDLLEARVGVGSRMMLMNGASPGAGGEQVEEAAGQEVGDDQRAGRLPSDQHCVRVRTRGE
jgi:hypothetical protein